MLKFLIKSTCISLLCFVVFYEAWAVQPNRFSLNFDSPMHLTEETIQFMLANKKIAPLEGIYRGTSDNPRHTHRVGIYKFDEGYRVVFLNGASAYLHWNEGEEMGLITEATYYSMMEKYALVKWSLPNKVLNNIAQIAFYGKQKLIIKFENSPTIFEYTKENNESKTSNAQLSLAITSNENPLNDELQMHLKNTMIARDSYFEEPLEDSQKRAHHSYGSSIAISKDGYVLTNAHVVEDAFGIVLTQYTLRGPQIYRAKVIFLDHKNDIAILKIDDESFKGLGELPYAISNDFAQQGEEVFTLGYPLSNQLGTEIKLEKGLITSEFGYQNDPKAYGTDLTLLPGNSGGALFSTKGTLLGLVYSRFSKSDHIGYAIISPIIYSIIQQTNAPIELPNEDKISHLPLTEQVKELKPFTFHVTAYR